MRRSRATGVKCICPWPPQLVRGSVRAAVVEACQRSARTPCLPVQRRGSGGSYLLETGGGHTSPCFGLSSHNGVPSGGVYTRTPYSTVQQNTGYNALEQSSCVWTLQRRSDVGVLVTDLPRGRAAVVLAGCHADVITQPRSYSRRACVASKVPACGYLVRITSTSSSKMILHYKLQLL